MPENKDASLPATTGGSTQNAALLRPARLPLSAYPASPPASRVPNTGQSSTIQGPTHIADTGTCVSTAANNAPDDGSRLATGRRLYQKLQRLYWTEDKHANEYNQYDPGCGPEGEGAETRREEVSQIMESFCVYDEKYVPISPLVAMLNTVQAETDDFIARVTIREETKLPEPKLSRPGMSPLLRF